MLSFLCFLNNLKSNSTAIITMDSSPTFQPMRKESKKRYEHILATAREILLTQRSLSPLSIHRLAVAMILSLTPICFESVNQQNRAYAKALQRHLATLSNLGRRPRNTFRVRNCDGFGGCRSTKIIYSTGQCY